jgi:hypothetical protein
MKTNPALFQITVLLLATVLFGGRAFSQPPGPQPARAASINPATGLPVTAGGLPAIDPVTGNPVPAAPTRFAPPDTGHASINPATGLPVVSGAVPAIDPITGLPVPVAPTGSAPPDDPLSQARELMNRGRFEQALQCYLSYHTKTRESLTNGPLVAALSDWAELGQRYPKAKQALLDIRDSNTREFVEGRGDTKLFSELADINTALGEKDSTYALFIGLEQSDAALARECYLILEPALVERGEYEVCARYLGNPQTWLDITRRTFEMGQGLAQQYAERRQQTARQLEAISQTNHWPRPNLHINSPSDTIRKAATNSFVHAVVPMLEILVASGRQAEAEKFRAQVLATADDPRLRPAISDVEAKVRAVQASRRPPPAPIAIHQQFVESSTLFAPELPAPSASVEHWSPRLEPGTKPPLQAILSAAKDYNAEKHYEESLQHHLWYHNHALEYEPEAQRSVRLSFALSDWAALGRKYPKAREALLEIRDRDLHEFAQGRGSVALFKDIEAINEQWGYDSTTCRLFKYLKDQQPELATRCYPMAEDALVKKGEYALCLAYIGDGQARFKAHCQFWEFLAKHEQHMAQVLRQGQQKAEEYMAQNGQRRPAGIPSIIPPPVADNLLVGNTRQLIEILVGAGHKADAENIRTQALALLDDPRLQSAVTDAEKKIGK